MRVQENSMEPALQTGDLVFVDKLRPKILKLKAGGIFVFRRNDKTMVVKRCFLVESDDIIIKNGWLLNTDGRSLLLEEPALAFLSALTKVPKQKYFFVGDNLQESLDSRNYGFIDKKEVIGQVIGVSSYD